VRAVHVVPTPFGVNGLFGGGERYPLELARVLARHIDCELLTFGQNAAAWREPAAFGCGYCAGSVCCAVTRPIQSLRSWHGRSAAPTSCTHINCTVPESGCRRRGRSGRTSPCDHGPRAWRRWTGQAAAGVVRERFLTVSQFSADNLGIPRDERSRCDRRHCRVSGQPDHGLEAAMDMEQRLVDRPGLSTAGEDAAWRSLRERLVIVLRPVGAPTAIGFFGLAAASLPFSGLQLGWVPVDQGRQVALVMIGFAFLAQALAAVFGLLARDGTAATAMATLALSWLVVGWVMNTSPPGTTSRALGLLLIFSGGAMLLIAATAALSKLVPAAVFLVASLRFFATAGYHLGGGQGWQRVAGVIGLVLFALAMYAAWAATLEDAVGRTVLPLGRRGKGKVAVTGSLLEQTKEVVTEPGVREQL
jgi:succinate-acetate transporter protein